MRRSCCPGAAPIWACPRLSPAAAAAAGARVLIVGAAEFGGRISPNWIPMLLDALEAGLDLAAGLHERLADVPSLRQASERLRRALYDVRQPQSGQSAIATGAKRTGMRLLTVGTDCAVGKMFTSLSIEAELKRRGVPATFRASGQTGILISGSGVSVDAIVSDFVSGAAELLSPENQAEHWDVVEGQGSLHHPAYAAVTLGLIHGSQPDALVLCHRIDLEHIDGYPHYPIPSFQAAIAANEAAARLTNPQARVVGISVNTSPAIASRAMQYLAELEAALNLPCCDPVRTGVGPLVDRLLQEFPRAG